MRKDRNSLFAKNKGEWRTTAKGTKTRKLIRLYNDNNTSPSDKRKASQEIRRRASTGRDRTAQHWIIEPLSWR